MKPRVPSFTAFWQTLCGLMVAALLALWPVQASAQFFDSGSSRGMTVIRDEPNAYQPPTEKPAPAEHGTAFKVLQAICWYPFNRLADLTDIPRLYLTVGDGMGGSIRATKFANATWFQDSAHCLGWSMRNPPFFSEQINERYFGFLAAQQGELDRDPSEVGASFHFIVVGLNAAASVSEAADFVLGFVGIDLRADDYGPVLGVDKTAAPATDQTEQPAAEPKTETTPAPASEPIQPTSMEQK